MYLDFWIFVYWMTLCCAGGQEQKYFTSNMKNSKRRNSRKTLQGMCMISKYFLGDNLIKLDNLHSIVGKYLCTDPENNTLLLIKSYCIDINGKTVKHEDPFVPQGDDFCQHCKCLSGKAKECFTTDCAVPTCKDYKAIPGKCCAYTCPSDSNSQATELAIIISLSVGLLLLLVLLIFVIDRNRKKNQRDRIRNEVLEQSQNLTPRPLNNRLPVISEENNDGIEPPPPYTPGRGRYSFRKPHYASPPFTPNEPPPPYEIDSREATDV